MHATEELKNAPCSKGGRGGGNSTLGSLYSGKWEPKSKTLPHESAVHSKGSIILAIHSSHLTCVQPRNSIWLTIGQNVNTDHWRGLQEGAQQTACLGWADEQGAVEGRLNGGAAGSDAHGVAGDVALLCLDLRDDGAQPYDVPLGLLEPARPHKQQPAEHCRHRQVHACRSTKDCAPDTEPLAVGAVAGLQVCIALYADGDARSAVRYSRP